MMECLNLSALTPVGLYRRDPSNTIVASIKHVVRIGLLNIQARIGATRLASIPLHTPRRKRFCGFVNIWGCVKPG